MGFTQELCAVRRKTEPKLSSDIDLSSEHGFEAVDRIFPPRAAKFLEEHHLQLWASVNHFPHLDLDDMFVCVELALP